MAEEKFDRLFTKVLAHWQGEELFVQDCFAGADPAYTLPIRVISGTAWHSLFGRQLFIRPSYKTLEDHVPQFTLMFLPHFRRFRKRMAPIRAPASQ
jgi:phosphoenolpyruvate carboxykinase (ATP)